MSIAVNVDNFVRAETDRMFAALQADAGGVNRLNHNRTPTPIEHQPVIRMNRDTLYSFALVDISQGATVTIPDSGDRYLSVMVVNQLGMHARAAAKFVHLAARFESKVRVARQDREMDGKSIMGLLLLAAARGTTIRISADGADEQAALDALAGLVESGFGEDVCSA